MAISAGSALISTLGAGVTLSGGTIAFSAAALIGQSFATHFLVSTAIGAAINALTPKPGTPGAAGYTVTAKGSNLDHQIIYGQTRVAGAVVADFLSGEGGVEGTRFLHRVQVMAGHEIESYEEIYVNSYKVTEWKANTAAGVGAVTGITDLTPWFNDPFAVLVPTKLVSVNPDGTETVVEDYDFDEYNGLAMQFWTGADDQSASTKLIANIPNSKWTSDHRLRGRAYMYIRMGRSVDGDNFPTGVPEITAVIKGRKVYDPREATHDPDDKSTWEWSDNPALCTRDYLTQDFGLGEKDIQVDDDLVTTAAGVCDQSADDGSTRYTCNGAFTTGIQPYDFLNSILTSMGGLLWYAQGQWRMKPAYWTAPVESFNEDDFRSAINVSTRHSRKDNFNTVEGTFRGPKSNYSLTTFPAVDSPASITADGGTVSKIDLEMPFTDTPEEARRIARIVLERNRQQLTVSASFGLKAFRVQVGDTVNLSLERFGWVNKTFEVIEWTFGNVDQYDIQVDLTLREITENVFDEVDDGATFELDNADVPSPLAGLAVTNLTATSGGFTATDGTFAPNILVSWDAIINSNVAEYIVEWGRAAFNFAEYGGEVTDTGSFTTREQFIFDAYNDILLRNPDQSGFDFYNTGGGSGLTETQIRLQLQNSPEKRAISGSVRVGGETTEHTISPAADDSMYSIRVKAINDFGTSSKWATVTINVGKDNTIPNPPTGLSASGGQGSVKLSWTGVTTNTDGSTADDIFLYAIYRDTSSNPTTLIDTTSGVGWSDVSLDDDTTYYYRVKAIDFSGNESDFSGSAIVNTNAGLTSGVSVATVNLFQKNTSATIPPSDPTGTFTYTFSTGVLSGGSLNGWSQSAPDINKGEYLWVLTATASSTEATDTIPSSEFDGSEAVVGIGGEDGFNQARVTLFQKNTSGSTPPSDPIGTFTYTFSTSTLSGGVFNGWSESAPSLNKGDYLWLISATATSVTDTDTISSSEFSAAVVVGASGVDGDKGDTGDAGDRTYTGIVYYSELDGTSPGLPSESGVTFNESTGQFEGGTFGSTPGWRHTQPKVDITDTTLEEWSAQYRVTVSGDLSFPQTSVPNTEFSFSNLSGAIQVTTNIQSDNFDGFINPDGTFGSIGTDGWAITRNGGNAIFNDVNARGDIIMSGLDSEIDLTTNPLSTVTVGIRMQPGNSQEIVQAWQWSSTQKTMRLTNFDDAGVLDISQISSGEGDALEVGTSGTANSSAVYAYNRQSGGGEVKLALSSNDAGWGIRVPTSSGNGVLSERNDNTSGKIAGRFENTNSGGRVRLGLPLTEQGWGVDIPPLSRKGIRSRISGTAAELDSGWFQNTGTGGGHAILGRSSTNNGYAVNAVSGDIRLSDGSTLPFTGAHLALFSKTSSISVGDIVCDDETVFTSIVDSITKVAVSSTPNDPSCIGVYRKTDADFDVRDKIGDDGTLEASYDQIQVNAVGEGAVNVCGEAGDISKGDLIVTSSTPGKGMKQSDDIVRSCTVAKAREDVTFSSPTEVKMVACIYLCG